MNETQKTGLRALERALTDFRVRLGNVKSIENVLGDQDDLEISVGSDGGSFILRADEAASMLPVVAERRLISEKTALRQAKEELDRAFQIWEGTFSD